MADTYEMDLGQKSSLTTSDFIRVVGSDNVSYKQNVANVRTALGIGASTAYGSVSAFYSEFSSMANNTKYFVTIYGDCSTGIGLPAGTYKGYVSKSTETLCDMTVQTYPGGIEYIGRLTFDSSGNVTASGWTTQPTRAEVDALNSQFTMLVTVANTALSVSVPNGYRGVVYFVDSAVNKCGEYIVYATGSGAVTLVPVKEASGLTISVSTRTITITSTSTTRVSFMNIAGTATV